MKRMLFNATQAEELRVAIVDGQSLIDLDIETLGKEQRKGNIYKGVITRIEPALEACFVDYGTDRHGFLPFKEVSRSYFNDYDGGRVRIQDVLKEGMEVIVQVEKDERGNKGAALTTFISLAGRYLVLMPNNPRGGGVSRRIEGEERQELKAALAELEVPRGMSLIARTAGIGRSVEELQWDLSYLQKLWQEIENAARHHREPYLLFMESSLLIRAIRDYFQPDIGEILIDTQEVYDQVYEFMSYVMPGYIGRLRHYDDHIPLFSRFQIEHQIESAFARSVSLPSGGAIVIDHTEALVSVDVNSARATRGADIEDTAFKTNMEAAEEVARQMRLRDLGGLVVIDFIDMESPKHQRDVENTLRDALKKDRARVQTGKLSRFGLLELSRQRLKPSLGESSHAACPRCAGTGFIRGIESTALHVLRIIQEEAMKENTGEVHAQVPVDVATFLLNEKRAELFGLEERLDVSVLLIPNTHLENPHYQITRVRTDHVVEDAAPSYQQVAVPEGGDELPFAIDRQKPAKPEPAVKGIKHSQPAPVVVAEEPGLFARLGAWLGKLFGGSKEAEAPKAAEKPKAQNRGGQQQAQRKKRQQERRQQPRAEQGERAERTERNNRNQDKKEREQRNDKRQGGNRQDERQDKQQAAALKAADNAAATTAQGGDEQQRNRRRRQRGGRKDDNALAESAVAVAAVADNGADTAAAEAPLVVTLAEAPVEAQDEQARPQKRRQRDERQNKRRQQDKRRHIPSAEKIIHFLDIPQAGALVTDAVNAVLHPQAKPLQAAPAVAETDPAAGVAAETASVAVTETAAVETAAPAVLPESSADIAVAEAEAPVAATQVAAAAAPAFEPVDLGDLVLVETRAEALAAVVPQAEMPVGKRRSDLPPAPVETEEPVVLQQVETRR
ncbi:ribonuclease E [Neisseria sp. HSC-16F19]|nr:Rne/Rng family ribonuclease [Neisseria sp. HSC-16F19]MCP2041548.1 ribonuclease E [Neisseria sp. HSC-16F19]